jgi:hypothetical protein
MKNFWNKLAKSITNAWETVLYDEAQRDYIRKKKFFSS